MWFVPANNPVITAEVRKSHFIFLMGNECIFWLGCNDLLVWSEFRHISYGSRGWQCWHPSGGAARCQGMWCGAAVQQCLVFPTCVQKSPCFGCNQLPLLAQIVYSLVKLMVGGSWAGKHECAR